MYVCQRCWSFGATQVTVDVCSRCFEGSQPNFPRSNNELVMAPRYPGTPGDLAEVIKPFAVVPDWIKYGELMNKSRVEVSKVLAHKKMWQELKTHHNSLAWSQKTMEDALLIVAGEQGKHVWPRELDEGEMASFSLRMARRIRTQARHITQAIAKNPQTGWLLRLWEEGHGGDEPGVEEQAMVPSDGVEEQAVVPSDWFYGYDRKLRKAWRRPADDSGDKQWSEVRCEGLEPDEHPIAEFDGERVRIAAITVEEVNLASSYRLLARGPLWTGTLADGTNIRISRRGRNVFNQSIWIIVPSFVCGSVAHNGLVNMWIVTQCFASAPHFQTPATNQHVCVNCSSPGRRPDREQQGLIQLAQLDETKKWRMVCNFKVSSFGNEDDALAKAFDAMKILGVKYAEGNIAKANLYTERDKMLEAMGVSMHKGAAKRPAACVDDAPTRTRKRVKSDGGRQSDDIDGVSLDNDDEAAINGYSSDLDSGAPVTPPAKATRFLPKEDDDVRRAPLPQLGHTDWHCKPFTFG